MDPHLSNKKKKRKQKRPQQKQTGPIIVQLSENDNGGKTTDMDAPTSKVVMKMPSFTGDDSDTLAIKMNSKPQTSILDSEEESFSDNDIEFEDTFKDRPNPVPSKPFVKFIDQPSKTDHILSKAQKPPPQKPSQPQPKQKQQTKKRAGSEMKAKVHSIDMPMGNDDLQISSVQTAISAIKDGFDFNAYDRTPQFYNSEKISQIHNFLDVVIMHIKNNPYYMFAAETATSIGKANETFFIHSTVQEIIRIITANGKMGTATSNHIKRFEMYSNAIKSIISATKSFGTIPNEVFQSSQYNDQIIADHLTTISESQKALHESFKNLKIIQNEMEIIDKILKGANLYLSSRFYFSSSLIALVNSAMVEIHNVTDAEGNSQPDRRYSSDSIITYRPELRNQLAQLCSLIYNKNKINAGDRYVSDREARRNLAAIQNAALVMKFALSTDDDMLDESSSPFAGSSSTASTPSPLYVPQLVQSQESIFEMPTPYITSLQSTPTIMTPPSPLEYGTPLDMFNTPSRSPRSSGKKKRPPNEIYIPGKYIRF